MINHVLKGKLWKAAVLQLCDWMENEYHAQDLLCSFCCFCAWHWYFWYRSQYGYIKSVETEDIFSSAIFAIIHILKTELHRKINRPSAKVCHDSAAAQRTAPGDWWDWSDLCSSREWELCKKSERKFLFNKSSKQLLPWKTDYLDEVYSLSIYTCWL